MTARFTGRTAVVTGASRGIGLAVARRLVDEGASVVITGREQGALAEAVTYLGGPDHALAVAGEVDDPVHQALTVARTIEVFGSLDLLVNNAGVNPGMGPLMETDLDQVRTAVEVNALAALAWVITAYEAGMRTHGGAMVNISSMVAVQQIPGLGSYGMSKAMLTHLTAQLAVELGPGVRVNAVAPALVKTRFAAPRYEGREEQVARLPAEAARSSLGHRQRGRGPAVRRCGLDHRTAPAGRRRQDLDGHRGGRGRPQQCPGCRRTAGASLITEHDPTRSFDNRWRDR